MTGPLLSVRDLSVEFATRKGPLIALDGVSFDIAPGEVLGVVGESGAGKSLTGLAIIGLLDPPGRIAGGEIRLDGERIDNLPPARMREIRGRRIGMIFQDPLTSLNPLLRIGDQLAETILAHMSLDAQTGAGAGDRLARRGRHSLAGQAHRRLSARILRRHAPARRHRARALRRARAGHRRRADDRARRFGAGADHRGSEEADAHARRRGDADHPRHGRDRRDGRSRRRDVRGPHRRDRRGRRGRAQASAPLRPGADGRDPDARGPRRPARADTRRHAAAFRDPARLRIRPALPEGLRPLRRASAADRGRRSRARPAGSTSEGGAGRRRRSPR